MKTISEFFGSDDKIWVLSLPELKSVKGGDEPVDIPPDPFKKK